MKFKPLPLIQELQSLPEEDRARRIEAITAAFLSTPFCQVLTDILRQQELAAYTKISEHPVDAALIQRAVGRIQCVEEIRRTLAYLAPNTTTDSKSDEVSEDYLDLE